MRSALICLFIAVILRKEGSRAEQYDDFKPTPIPLNNWTGANHVPAGTLQEFIKTDSPPTVAALPAHYWEDALRHSVYLTLVRDKIDQLIANGVVISPNSKPDGGASKEIDDHDLWEKIKSAPFDRIQEAPLPPGDTIILARGRLLKERDGYRFTEGEPEKCSKINCTQAVKAYWSVKRSRHDETSPGKYHYELTFSVTSQSTRALRRQYENPVRTFTIRENAPTKRPPPQSYRIQEPQIQHGRTQRAVWIHKNIGPSQNYQRRPGNTRGLERIFSSLFSDEDNNDDVAYRQKPNVYIPQSYQKPKQHAKISRYVSEREPFHAKKIYSYPIKPAPFLYPSPPLQSPPLSHIPHPYFDVGHDVISHVPIDPDNRPIPSIPVKTTKPAILPTPVSNIQLFKEPNAVEPGKTMSDFMDYVTREPELASTTYKIYTHKQAPMKVNYLPENIRPPIYNAPPGVFVTMDKNHFKPMPPLKSISPKPHKNLPSDFRPSPQILESPHTNTDSIADTVFRPISLSLTEPLNIKKDPKYPRKPFTGKKSSQKPENIKPIRLTTISPDIITIHNHLEKENNDMIWAEILAAFTRTTPMASQREKEIPTENDYFVMTTTVPTTTTEEYEDPTTTSTARTTTTITTTTTTTTAKPKRTRPPPKFKKPEKVKKHKRITSTTTSTTTTAKPTRIYPTNKISSDLMPQASSAATNGLNSIRESKPTGVPASTSPTTSTTASASTSTTPTTTRTLTTTKVSTTTVTPSTTVQAKQSKGKNRFRLSMLMQKGTSVNHDKWSTAANDKNRTTTVIPTSFPLRRKASKFQGHIPSSTPRNLEKERNKEDHKDHGFSSNIVSSTTTHTNDDNVTKTPTPTQPHVEDSKNKKPWIYDMDDIIDIDTTPKQLEINKVNEHKDSKEFLFPLSSDSHNNSNINTQDTKTNATVISPITVENNRTKCKKKKHQNLTTTDTSRASSEVETTTATIQTSSINATSTITSDDMPDLFDQFLGGFTMDDVLEEPKANTSPTNAPDEPKESESIHREEVIQIDDDIENFLNSLQPTREKNSNQEHPDENDDEDSFASDEFDRDMQEEYYDDSEIPIVDSQEQPFNLLELIAKK